MHLRVRGILFVFSSAAYVAAGLQPGSAEVLRGLGNFLNMVRPEHQGFVCFLCCLHHSWSTAWQCRSTERLGELPEHGQARASKHRWPEEKRNGQRKWSTFHPPRAGVICLKSDRHRHSFEGNLGNTAGRWGAACMGISEHYDLERKVDI